MSLDIRYHSTKSVTGRSVLLPVFRTASLWLVRSSLPSAWWFLSGAGCSGPPQWWVDGEPRQLSYFRSGVRARLLEAEPIPGNRYPSLTCGRSSSPGGHLLRLEHSLVANQWIFSSSGTCCSLPWAFCSFPSLLANRQDCWTSLRR